MSINKTPYMAKLAINKSLLKEYSDQHSDERVVYMNDGDEFQIQFFNPTTKVLGVQMFLNGSSYSSNYLILKPGERVWLERFFDTDKKFKFSTYEVGASKEVQEAIKENGVIKINFFNEVENTIICSSPKITWINYSHSCGNDYLPNYTLYADSGNLSVSSSYDAGVVSSISCASNATGVGASSYTSYSSASTIGERSLKSHKTHKKDSVETGRIDKGSRSNQDFTYVNGYSFNSYPSYTEILHIYPLSTKPIFKKDLVKKYCSNCGRKLSPKHKFCPYCGSKVN